MMQLTSRFLVVVGFLFTGCVVQPAAPAPQGPPAPSSGGAAPAAEGTLDPSGLHAQGAFHCDGQQEMTLEAVSIDVPGTAVDVSGQCDVTIRGSRLRGGAAGLVISGQGHVTLVDCEVISDTHSLVMSGQGTLTTSGSRYQGGVDRSEQASVEDQGGNTW